MEETSTKSRRNTRRKVVLLYSFTLFVRKREPMEEKNSVHSVVVVFTWCILTSIDLLKYPSKCHLYHSHWRDIPVWRNLPVVVWRGSLLETVSVKKIPRLRTENLLVQIVLHPKKTYHHCVDPQYNSMVDLSICLPTLSWSASWPFWTVGGLPFHCRRWIMFSLVWANYDFREFTGSGDAARKTISRKFFKVISAESSCVVSAFRARCRIKSL